MAISGWWYRREVIETEERTAKTIKKSLHFEKSGETFSVEVSLENVSPGISAETIIPFLNTLFESAKKNIKSTV